MIFADIAGIAGLIILIVVAIDVVRGKTGFGKHVLTKTGSTQRYWLILALYINLAFFLFWLAGKAVTNSPNCDPETNTCVLVIKAPEQ